MRLRRWRLVLSLLTGLVVSSTTSGADEPNRRGEFLTFIKAQAAALRANDAAPQTIDAWKQQRAKLRQQLADVWRVFPAENCPLEPQKLGEMQFDGYRLEKLIFQTRPGVWMTAHAYVPDKPGKLPAILQVHGHWKEAKQAPTVQSRCIGAAKLGFFVLAVDAFGAGERGIKKALGEYHGEMTGALLFPLGMPLSGIQVHENMRAVDYLLTRPEVDGSRIGVTGASGGGNQSMYAGAWDERLNAAVPTCSVGNYQAYLGAACCMCEVVPGALRFTEESGVLALTAPRGLMVNSATKDAFQFSVGEAKKSLAAAQPIFDLYQRPSALKHTVFDWHHDYSQPMREAMYGWMTRHLKQDGDGSPVKEPDLKPADPEAIRCYPGDTRPDDYLTLPQFAAREARQLLIGKDGPSAQRERRNEHAKLQGILTNLLGGFPQPSPLQLEDSPFNAAGVRTLKFSPEPGLTLIATHKKATASQNRLALVLNLDDGDGALQSPLAEQLLSRGWDLVVLDLRATGKLAYERDTIGRAPDHNSAEWSLWLGRPLLGQWTYDVRRTLDALAASATKLPPQVAVVGQTTAGLVALSAAATDPRVTHVATVGSLTSYVSDTPYQGQRLGLMVPAILRDLGDVPHLAAVTQPQRLVIAGGVNGAGRSLTSTELAAAYAPLETLWRGAAVNSALTITTSMEAQTVADELSR